MSTSIALALSLATSPSVLFSSQYVCGRTGWSVDTQGRSRHLHARGDHSGSASSGYVERHLSVRARVWLDLMESQIGGAFGVPVTGIAGNVPSSLGNNMHIDEIQDKNPTVARILFEHACTLAQNLYPNIEGGGLLQFKTGLTPAIRGSFTPFTREVFLFTAAGSIFIALAGLTKDITNGWPAVATSLFVLFTVCVLILLSCRLDCSHHHVRPRHRVAFPGQSCS